MNPETSGLKTRSAKTPRRAMKKTGRVAPRIGAKGYPSITTGIKTGSRPVAFFKNFFTG